MMMSLLLLCSPFYHLSQSVSIKPQLEHCIGKTDEDFAASPEITAKAQTLEHPQLHEDFYELKFFLAMRQMMDTCGYDSFSWRDLHSPTAKRVRDQLSAIINLAKFRKETIGIYAELSEPVSHCFVED